MSVSNTLRSHFEGYGPLHTWAPIRGFARVIMVYFSEEDAEFAKECNDGIVFGDMSEKYVPFPPPLSVTTPNMLSWLSDRF